MPSLLSKAIFVPFCRLLNLIMIFGDIVMCRDRAGCEKWPELQNEVNTGDFESITIS